MTQAAALKYMKRVDTREIPYGTNEIRGFLVVRNEKLRLPSTLRHHRSLGVRRFFALDNGSTDGTLDYLCGEPDVHVFSTSSSYAESNYGLTWTNELLNAFGSGHWTLTIDADEQFIFPHYEGNTLPQFYGFLDSIGAEAVPCLLLDMYPGVAIRDATRARWRRIAGTWLPGGLRLSRAGPRRPSHSGRPGGGSAAGSSIGCATRPTSPGSTSMARWGSTTPRAFC